MRRALHEVHNVLTRSVPILVVMIREMSHVSLWPSVPFTSRTAELGLAGR